ncbi:MAG: hypothetical protein TREMPRED_002150 [Tremellales sp. Tagirdzhanova-0007]|nr:MAG: hypothetical protein TREMPRED_002150 [Tremellales sp. Tagirdzhanova-0007]
MTSSTSPLGLNSPTDSAQRSTNELSSMATYSKHSIKPNVYLASSIISFTGFLFGYDAGAIGPITQIPHFYSLSSQMRGVIVAALLFTVIPATFVAGPLADHLGRCRVISLGGLIYAAGMGICSGADGVAMFLVGRLLAGAGQGLFFSTAGVWQIESAPKAIRGRIGSMSQLFIPFGLVVGTPPSLVPVLKTGYFVCYGTIHIDSSWSWRTVTVIQTAIALLFTLAMLTALVPESPRWLLLHTQRHDEAFRIVHAFALDPMSAQVEYLELNAHITREKHYNATLPKTGKRGWLRYTGLAAVRECFKQESRGRVILGLIYNLMLALTGIDAVVWYAPLIYISAGLSTNKASFLASGVMAIIMTVITVPAQFYFIDHIKRRTTVAIGSAVMAIALFIIGILYTREDANKEGVKWTIVYVAAVEGFYVGPAMIYSAEIQTNRTRATSSAMGRALLSLANMILALFTPQWLESSRAGFFMTLAGFNAFSFALALVFTPETLGVSIEGFDEEWNRKSDRLQKALKMSVTAQTRDDDRVQKGVDEGMERHEPKPVEELATGIGAMEEAQDSCRTHAARPEQSIV